MYECSADHACDFAGQTAELIVKSLESDRSETAIMALISMMKVNKRVATRLTVIGLNNLAVRAWYSITKCMRRGIFFAFSHLAMTVLVSLMLS